MLSYGWIQPGPQSGSEPGATGAMGPAGTAKIVWEHRDGHTTSSRAEHTVATTRSTDVTQARFLDASGRQIGSIAISSSTPWTGSQMMLPQVAEALARP